MIKRGYTYRCQRSFLSEDMLFEKDKEYILKDIINEELFTLYVFEGNILFGDFDNDFNEYFISAERERVRNLQKVIFG